MNDDRPKRETALSRKPRSPRCHAKDPRYAVVIEKAPSNYAAYVPDLPGCIATGAAVAETESLIRKAIGFHLEGLKGDGLPVPPPNSKVESVEVTA